MILKSYNVTNDVMKWVYRVDGFRPGPSQHSGNQYKHVRPLQVRDDVVNVRMYL